MSDQLLGGQRFRLLTLVDNFSRESLAIRVGQRLAGDDVVRVLEEVTQWRGKPQRIQTDNGPEFISKSLDCWAYWNGMKLDFSRPGKPTDNPYIDSFNGRLRDSIGSCHCRKRSAPLTLGGKTIIGIVPTAHLLSARRASSRFFQQGLAPAEKPSSSNIPLGTKMGARSLEVRFA